MAKVAESTDISLDGGGASFPVQILTKWGAAFEFARSDYVNVKFSYQRGSSYLGKVEMKKFTPKFSFGATEVDYSQAEKNLNPNLTLLPVVAG